MPEVLAVDQILERKLPQGVKILRKGETTLDKNAFLKLLITELTHQDPLRPMDDKEFIAQMAQFSALEEMHNVSRAVASLRKVNVQNLLGKIVEGRDMEKEQLVRGKVVGVYFSEKGEIILRLEGGKRVSVKSLTSIALPSVSRETNSLSPAVSRETNTQGQQP